MEDKRIIESDSSTAVLVPRSDIPISTAPEDLDLESRPFLGHQLLGSIMPPSGVVIAWTHAQHGHDVTLRSHSKRRLIIVLKGSAELVGQTRRFVQSGDVITLPSDHEYGFTSVGQDGLHALHVELREDADQATAGLLTLEHLLAVNDARAQKVLDSPFFLVLRNGALDADRKRSLFLNCIRVFSNAFQTILFTREATCRDEHFRKSFHSHFLEELGHNDFLQVSGNERAFADPLLRATSSWFCHQMLLLDNIGKAVLVHLVLETAGYHFHTLAKPALGRDVCDQYFDAHSEENEQQHKEEGIDLLRGQHPETYRRLHRVLNDGWDMFEAMTKRIVQLVELESASS